ncbi:hypothetical protein ACFSTH_19385 [Paenibacillus yanchengensis]|uniref:CoA-binding domain-containing protein n=1 Tax=Paenibacillus yanchengensis TaxID=2035833 RepID=A0ABW4YNC6_9BACL
MMVDIENALNPYLQLLCSKKVIVFGAGSGGKQALSVLEKLNIKVEYVIDNNEKLAGEKIFHYSIYSAKETIGNINFDSYVILVASIHYDEITTQLSEAGMKEYIHYMSAWGQKRKNYYHAGYFSESAQMKHEKADILLFGDSVYSYTSNDDSDTTTLNEMMTSKMVLKNKVEIIHSPGFHLGVFYYILNALIATNRLPKVVVLPINMRSFAPIWELNPNQFSMETMNELSELMHHLQYEIPNSSIAMQKVSFDEFINNKNYYPGIGMRSVAEILAWSHINKVSKKQSEQEYRTKLLYSSHYLSSLNSENKRLQVLKNIIKLCEEYHISLFTYIMPINYEYGLENFKEEELQGYRENIHYIGGLLEDGKENIFKDYSELITRDCFRHHNYVVEHLNQFGREKFSDKLAHDLKKWINKKAFG